MWKISETENELTIKAFPFLVWSGVLVFFIFEFYFLQIFYEGLSDAASASELFNLGLFNLLLTAAAYLFFPLIGLVLFHFVPFAITRINREKQVLNQTTYTLFGKRTREFGFSVLKGGIRVSAEEDDEGKEQNRLYFETEKDEKIYLSKEFSFRKSRTFDIAIKANEFFRKKIDS